VADIVREMLISYDPYETRVAVIEDQSLVELYVERPKRSVVGNVYLGRVRDVLPGMQAAFVDIGLEKNAFLYVDEVVAPEGVTDVPKRDIQSLLKPGQQVMVQVLKDPMGTKGARVTTEITLPGRFLVLMPFSGFTGVSRKLAEEERDRLHEIVTPLLPEGLGVIVRTAAAGATAKELESDLEFLVRLWKRVQTQARSGLAPEVVYTEIDLALRMARDVFSPEFKRLVIDDVKLYDKVVSFLQKTSPDLVRRVHQHKERVPLFEANGVLLQAEKALVRTVPLPSGGHLTVDKTEALTAIDVNTGSYVGRKNLEETVVKTNLEAADEAVRQLRLRERDRTKTRLGEMTRLGLVEITRKNVTDGLYGVLTERCPTCGGEGRVLSDATRRISAERRMREVLTSGRSSAYVFGLHPETYALVTAPGTNVVAILRAETGKHVTILADPDCGPTDVKVIVEGHSGGAAADEQPARRGPWPRRRE